MKASFRDYIETLRKNNELLEIAKPVDLRDVAALVAQSEKALLFKNLPGYSMSLVSGLLQSRNRIALGMGVAYADIADKLGKAMDKPIQPKRVSNAPVKEVKILDAKGNLYKEKDSVQRFFEAAWMHKYKDKYYFSYSTGDTHFINYATGDNPYGPFTYQGVVLNPVDGWTNHHSIIELNGKWYIFYHDVQLSGKTHLRNVKVTQLTYNPDGSIQTVHSQR
jgi:hypothetical protein